MTAEYFNESETTISWLIKFYNIKKTREEKRISLINKYGNLNELYTLRCEKRDKAYIEKYGSIEAFYDYRNDKVKKTVEERYGSYENYLDQRTECYQATIKDKYGINNISQLDKIKNKKKDSLISHYGSLDNAYKARQEKTNNTLIKKYGSVKNYREFQQEKARKTFEKNYGVMSPFASAEIQEKIKEVIRNKYGVDYSCMINKCVSHQHSSKPNLQFEQLLTDYDLKIDKKEFVLGKFIYDFKIGNFLVEINPFPTHNINWSPFGEKAGIDEDYHQRKSINAFENNYRCIHVWDWDDLFCVLENIKNKKYILDNQKFGKRRKFIYDYKLKKLVNTESNTTVVIFDDGIILEKGEL